MGEFSRLTIVSACSVLGGFLAHSDLELLETEWGVSGRVNTTSKPARAADLAKIVLADDVEVLTENGKMPLSRAIVEKAIHATPQVQNSESWRKLIAGLRMDGFEITITEVEAKGRYAWSQSVSTSEPVLRRMYPQDVPSFDFKEAENEVQTLLRKHGFATSEGHLSQAISAFSRGDWAASNGQLRTFFESYLREIAGSLGFNQADDAKAVRKHLGEISPPFLLADYNEWSTNDNKPQYFAGLWARMHPQGSHPGLSEEDDCAFRLHLTLVTARLLLRRFDQRRP